MTFKEIQELIKLITKSDLAEFKVKDGEFELLIRTKHYEKAKPLAPVAAVAPLPAVSPPPAPPPFAAAPAQPARPAAVEAGPALPPQNEEEDAAGYLPIKSPIVGTFYRSPSPEKGPYVKVGDIIEVGSVVCIVEAMKLFNEIESEIAGKIVRIMVEDAQPVEYDQVLFLVDPKG